MVQQYISAWRNFSTYFSSPLKVDPYNPVRVWGSAVSYPERSRIEHWLQGYFTAYLHPRNCIWWYQVLQYFRYAKRGENIWGNSVHNWLHHWL